MFQRCRQVILERNNKFPTQCTCARPQPFKDNFRRLQRQLKIKEEEDGESDIERMRSPNLWRRRRRMKAGKGAQAGPIWTLSPLFCTRSRPATRPETCRKTFHDHVPSLQALPQYKL